MRYLLDSSALVALGLIHHEFHERVAGWARAQQFPRLATCAITELDSSGCWRGWRLRCLLM
jgi:hypothetical protein